MRFLRKPTAALVVAYIFWFGFLGYAPNARAADSAPITLDAIDNVADEVTHVSGDSRVTCRDIPYSNLLVNPVEADWKPDPRDYKILTLTEESCGQMKGGDGKWVRGHLRKGIAIAVPLNGKGEWRVVACGNPYKPEGDVVGKYFQCPTLTCPPPEVRTIEVEGPERVVYRDREPSLGTIPAPPRRAWCLRGYGPLVCFALPALILGAAFSHHGGKKDCTDCCPTCPPRDKPKP